ncbi:hypothetical protein [Brachybacterium hainanense]|uniref:SUKH-4 immunity protein of toxin-antitoxin system n=1 Tax=Brachybacterium hainanense TaxID=1541174 RepID=A0ABV6R7V8_9MICO
MDPRPVDWPGSALLPVAPLRPVLERLASLARTHEDDVELVPGLAEAEAAGDPPPALVQIVEELGGISVRGGSGLELLTASRSDEGPYTLLGAPTTFYPLHEGADVAVVLTLDEDGRPGAVHGIGEDLALRLAAPDLGTYLERYADALEATLTALDASPAEGSARDEAARDLMDEHLFDALLGTGAAAELPLREMVAPARAEGVELPVGALASGDLRDAAVGTGLDVIDAPIDGDPLEHHLAWCAEGLVVCWVPRP